MAYQTAWRILGHAQDTEDAVQDALLEVLRAYRADPVENWGGLLRRVVTRRALDRLRKRRATTQIPADASSSANERPDLIAEGRDLADWLRRFVGALPERQAEVFCLRFFGEMTNPEIAEALGMSLDAVGVSLHKARSRVAAAWAETEEIPARHHRNQRQS